jgi:hypothetical protein
MDWRDGYHVTCFVWSALRNNRTVFSALSMPRLYNTSPLAAKESENIRGLNLEVVKLMTVQVTRLPLQHKICKAGMICAAKPVVTEDLCVVQKQEFFNNMLYVRNIHSTKGQAQS